MVICISHIAVNVVVSVYFRAYRSGKHVLAEALARIHGPVPSEVADLAKQLNGEGMPLAQLCCVSWGWEKTG
jgi:hypothetical protein